MLTQQGPPTGPPASLPPPKRRLGRRITRLPAIIFIAVGCIIAGSVAYTLHERAEYEKRVRQLAQAAPSAADASTALKDMPSGWIPAAAYPRPIREPVFRDTLQAEKTKEPKKEEDEDAKEREAARKQAWKSYWEEFKQLRKDRFDKQKEALVALNTSVETKSGHGAAASDTTQPATAAPVAQTGASGYGGGGWGSAGTPGLWGGGLPGFGGGFAGLGPAPQIDREGQEQKISFAGQAGDLGKNDVVPTVRKPPDPYAVMAGSFVKFTTINEVNSDVPGSQIGMVTESVSNTSDGACVLIPQGSKLIGHYNSVVSAGQGRLPGVLTRIIFPDGSSQAIGAMESADNAGSAGQEDQINRHLIQKFGGALLAGAFGAAIQLSIPQQAINGYSSQQIIAASLGQQMGQLGQQLAQQSLSIPNTVTIRAGYNGTMITDKDLHITPWSCHGGQQRHLMMPIMSVQQ